VVVVGIGDELIRERTEKCVQECGAFPAGTRVVIFGSSANGFGSPKSDLDMCLQLPDASMLPQSKDEVLSKVKRGRIGQFHAKACPLCHGPTNYTKWYDYKSDDFYPITDVEGKFEPYVLGSRVGAPLYWEAFRGFGFNKRSWFAEITVAGYKFAVLRDFWVAHLQHRELNVPSKKTAIKNRKTWEEFHGYLTKTYGRSVNY
jgi:hypothetical protein